MNQCQRQIGNTAGKSMEKGFTSVTRTGVITSQLLTTDMSSIVQIKQESAALYWTKKQRYFVSCATIFGKSEKHCRKEAQQSFCFRALRLERLGGKYKVCDYVRFFPVNMQSPAVSIT